MNCKFNDSDKAKEFPTDLGLVLNGDGDHIMAICAYELMKQGMQDLLSLRTLSRRGFKR